MVNLLLERSIELSCKKMVFQVDFSSDSIEAQGTNISQVKFDGWFMFKCPGWNLSLVLQVVYFGLHIITPLISLELLKYPKLCHDVRCHKFVPFKKKKKDITSFFQLCNFVLKLITSCLCCSTFLFCHICWRSTQKHLHSWRVRLLSTC